MKSRYLGTLLGVSFLSVLPFGCGQKSEQHSATKYSLGMGGMYGDTTYVIYKEKDKAILRYCANFQSEKGVDCERPTNTKDRVLEWDVFLQHLRWYSGLNHINSFEDTQKNLESKLTRLTELEKGQKPSLETQQTEVKRDYVKALIEEIKQIESKEQSKSGLLLANKSPLFYPIFRAFDQDEDYTWSQRCSRQYYSKKYFPGGGTAYTLQAVGEPQEFTVAGKDTTREAAWDKFQIYVKTQCAADPNDGSYTYALVGQPKLTHTMGDRGSYLAVDIEFKKRCVASYEVYSDLQKKVVTEKKLSQPLTTTLAYKLMKPQLFLEQECLDWARSQIPNFLGKVEVID